MQEMIFQLAVVDAPIEVRIDPANGDLLVEFPGRHRAVLNRRMQVRFKPGATDQLRKALLEEAAGQDETDLTSR